MAQTPNGASTRVRVAGLDSLRAILALVVVFAHVRPLSFSSYYLVDYAFGSIYRYISWDGPAVIGFFVISGFCIHYGNLDPSFSVKSFYLRRYVRITIPLLIAVILATRLRVSYWPWSSVTWSLACEEAYYFVYPLFRLRIFEKWGYYRTTVGALLFGLMTLILLPLVMRVEDGIGIVLLLIAVYFPVWLLGAALADWIANDNQAELSRFYVPLSPGLQRFIVVILFGLEYSCSLEIHAIDLTRLVAGALFFIWLVNELGKKTLRTPGFLERAGKWSYSLYLTHTIWVEFVRRGKLPQSYSFRWIRELLDLKTLHGWGLGVLMILAASYLFYRIVEKPSHQWSRRLGRATARFTIASESQPLSGQLN